MWVDHDVVPKKLQENFHQEGMLAFYLQGEQSETLSDYSDFKLVKEKK